MLWARRIRRGACRRLLLSRIWYGPPCFVLVKLYRETDYRQFIGGAVNPRDSDLKITSDGDEIVFNGFKNFNTGGVVSDLTVLEGVLEGTEDHIFTFVNTRQDGMQYVTNP